jgi:small-conductance mechanosensitive channel
VNKLLNFLNQHLTTAQMASAGRALVLLVVGYVLARILAGALHRVMSGRVEPLKARLFKRTVRYGVLSIFALAALAEFGFDLKILLGAAGVLSVAVGFASQTSASNLISGLFLIAENPFNVGDVVTVGETTGEVLSIDLLSVKLRTFDNLFVRIPNETVLKTEVRTLTRFPIRRFDLKIGVAYKEDLAEVRRVLADVADRNPLCLEEPAPLFILTGFGSSSLDIQFSVWATRENYLPLRNSIQEEIKRAFDREGIEIPFPHLSIYAGSVTGPLPVRVVEGDSVEPEGG